MPIQEFISHISIKSYDLVLTDLEASDLELEKDDI